MHTHIGTDMDGLIISSFLSYFVLRSDLCPLFGLLDSAVRVRTAWKVRKKLSMMVWRNEATIWVEWSGKPIPMGGELNFLPPHVFRWKCRV